MQQCTNTVDFQPIIIAIAGFISLQIPVIIGILRLMVENRGSRARQALMIAQNNNIIKEQVEVKNTLNGNNALIPKMDKGIKEIKANQELIPKIDTNVETIKDKLVE